MVTIPSVEQAEAAALCRSLNRAASRLRELTTSIDRAALDIETGHTQDYAATAARVIHEMNCTLMNVMVVEIVRTAAAADTARATGQ